MFSQENSENTLHNKPSTSTQEFETTKIKKPVKNRRTRSASPGTPTEDWTNLLTNFFNKNKSTLTLYQFQNFIELAQNSNEVFTLSKNYTNNPDVLLNIMETLRNETNNRSAKNRLTRTINKLILQSNGK